MAAHTQDNARAAAASTRAGRMRMRFLIETLPQTLSLTVLSLRDPVADIEARAVETIQRAIGSVRRITTTLYASTLDVTVDGRLLAEYTVTQWSPSRVDLTLERTEALPARERDLATRLFALPAYCALGHADDVIYALGHTPAEALDAAVEDAGYRPGYPVPHLDVDDARDLFRAAAIWPDDARRIERDGYDDARTYKVEPLD